MSEFGEVHSIVTVVLSVKERSPEMVGVTMFGSAYMPTLMSAAVISVKIFFIGINIKSYKKYNRQNEKYTFSVL